MKQAYGAIVLAAYKPNEELFLRQLKSLQNQTHKNFVCLIGADGDHKNVVSFVDKHFGEDSRFKVIGFDKNVGFYRNFERILEKIPKDAEWVALSDQDDYWYPNKLEILLPHLQTHSLVSGQARVISHPENKVLTENTKRKNVPFSYLVLENQFTGAICVFRTELLKKALPFPTLCKTREYHDHWLALCANFAQGTLIVDVVVQDYMQHAHNVIGEARTSKLPQLKGAKKRFQDKAQKTEGDTSYKAILTMIYAETWGYSKIVTKILLNRFGKDLSKEQFLQLNSFQKSVYPLVIWKILFTALFSKRFSLPAVIHFILGIPGYFFTKNKATKFSNI